MPLRRSPGFAPLPLWGALILSSLLPAQAEAPPSVALQRVLSGRVEGLTSEGLLTLRYPFDSARELGDFETRGMSPQSVRVEGGRLLLKRSEEDERSAIELGGIHFTGDLALKLTLTPRWPDAGLILGLADSSERGGQTWMVLNGELDERSGERGHVMLRAVPGLGPRPTSRPRPAKEFKVDQAHEVTVTVQEGTLTLAIDGRRVATDPRFPHERFQLFLAPTGGSIELDELRLSGRIVDDSLRKLLKGGAARESETARNVEAGKIAAIALVREHLDEPIPRTARAALRELPESARVLALKARESEGMGEIEDAALLYQEAAVLAPEAAVLVWQAGRALLFAGEVVRARTALELAVELDAESAEAWRDLGTALNALEKDGAAAAAFQRSLALNDESALAHALHGALQQGQGRLAEAKVSFEAAVELKPGREAYRLLLRDLERIQAPPDWRNPFRAETEHYAITTDVSEEFARKVGTILEHYRKALEEILPLPGAQNVRSPVWIFDSRGEYNVFAGTLMSRAAERTAGVYHPSIKTLLLFDEIDREATFDTIFHEAFHQYLDRVNRAPPIWFNEGMAEVFGALRMDPENGEVLGFGIQISRLQELRHVLAEEPERIPDLDELLQMPKIEFYDCDAISLNYAVAWSLCAFFLHQGETPAAKTFARYTAEVIAGKTPEQAYAASFGASPPAKAENHRGEWLRFVRRL